MELPIRFLFRSGRNKILEQVQRKESPADFLYGYSCLLKNNADVRIVEFSNPPASWFLKKVFRLVETFLGGFLLCKIYLKDILRLYSSFQQTGIWITNIDNIGMSLAFLKFLNVVRVQQIHVSQGLTNQLDLTDGGLSLRESIAVQATSMLLNTVECPLVLGVGALSALGQYGFGRSHRFNCLQFGVDVAFWKPSDEHVEEDYILSVGSDAGRDFETLLHCRFACELKVVSRTHIKEQPQVVQLTDITDRDLLALYQKCKFVVVSLKDISQPSGQSVTLQAMACGKPVIISKTRGFWDHGHFVDDESICFVEHGNADQFSAKMSELYNDPLKRITIGRNARKLVLERYSMSNYGAGLQKCVNELSAISHSRLV